MTALSAEKERSNGRNIDFSVDGNDPLSRLCSGKLRTYDTVQVVGSIWAWLFHKHSRFWSIQTSCRGCSRSHECASMRDCKAPISSDTPEAITHDGSIVPGSSATPSRPPGIAYASCRGSVKAVPPAVPSSLGTQAGSGRWVSMMLIPPWSLITPVATFLDRRKCIRPSCWPAWCQRGVKNSGQCVDWFSGFHLHAISREAGSHPHAISREAGARMLSVCWHIALGTPSE